MIGVILAGGYAKRMGKICENTAKALLIVDDKPIIEHIMEKIERIDLKKIYISTNKKFENDFREWIKKYDSKKLELVIEPTTEEDKKLGAIGGIEFVIKRMNIDDDLMIIGGDNLFDFELTYFIDFYKENKRPLIGLHDIKNIEFAKHLGVVELDENKKITSLEEKPENPKSTLTSTAIYMIPKESISKVSEYLNGGGNKDAIGFFFMWLHKKEPVYGFVFEKKWIDIGTPQTLEEARKSFRD